MHSGGALNESVVTKGLSALKTNWWRCTDGVNSVTFDIFCLPPSGTTIARAYLINYAGGFARKGQGRE